MGYLNYTAYQSLKNLFIIKENTTGSIMEFLYNETSRLANGTREISLDFTALTTSARLSINPFVGNKLYIQSFRIIQLPDAPATTPPAELVSTGITSPVLATPTGTNMNLSVGTANSTIVALTDTAKTLIFKPRIIPQAQYQLQFDIQWPAGSTQQQKTMQLQGISVAVLNTNFTAGANTALVNFVGGAIDGGLKLTFGLQGVTIRNIKYTVQGSPVVMADSARTIKNTYSLSGNLWTTAVVDGNLVFTPNNATEACTLTRQFSGLVVGRTYRLLVATPNTGAPTSGTLTSIVAEGSTTPMFTMEANLPWQTITSSNSNTNAPRSGYSQVNGTGIKEYYLIFKATTSSITINYLGAKTNANLGGRSLRHIKLIQEPVFEGYSENDLASGYRYGFQAQEKDDDIKGEGNFVIYSYRMHDTRLGRFISIDPMFWDYPFYSPYAFSGNRVFDAVELEGLQPGILFPTMDAAAANFGTFYGDNSIRIKKEYGSTIYKVTNAAGIIEYAYSVANIGTTGYTVTASNSPSGTTPVADIHTHGAYSFGNFFDNIFSGSTDDNEIPYTPAQNLKSTYGDIGAPDGGNNVTGLIGYLVTPNGSLQKYDPATGIISTINTNNPSDPNDPTRLNSVSTAPTPVSYTIQKGDNLSSIAKRFDTSVSAIVKENNIANPNKVSVGTKITITN